MKWMRGPGRRTGAFFLGTAAVLLPFARAPGKDPCSLPPISDPVGQAFDQAAHADPLKPLIDTEHVDPDLLDALQEFQSIVDAETGGSVVADLTSGFRPQSYQRHLFKIRKEFERLAKLGFKAEGTYLAPGKFRPRLKLPPDLDTRKNKARIQALQCLMDDINGEIDAHLLVSGSSSGPPAVSDPDNPKAEKKGSASHTKGKGIDIAFLGGTISQHDIDRLALQAGLYRPYGGDLVHHELVPATSAKLARTLAVSIQSQEGGTGTVSADPPGAKHPFGEEVTLTAVPDVGSEFLGWKEGAITSTGTGLTLLMTRSRAVVAVFGPGKPYTGSFATSMGSHTTLFGCTFGLSLSGTLNLRPRQGAGGAMLGDGDVDGDLGIAVTYNPPYTSCSPYPFTEHGTGTIGGSNGNLQVTLTSGDSFTMEFSGVLSGDTITGSATWDQRYSADGDYVYKTGTIPSLILTKQP